MNRVIQFFREVRVELGKVVWPSRREALKMTGIVIVFSLAIAVFLSLVDIGIQELLKLILK